MSEASPVTCFNPFSTGRKPGSIGTNILNVKTKSSMNSGKSCLPAKSAS
ncbi:hypothetical protein PO124_10090 [Bacillus licheniformis]|nr:hypothetical protein [Bacillus licheniformis]